VACADLGAVGPRPDPAAGSIERLARALVTIMMSLCPGRVAIAHSTSVGIEHVDVIVKPRPRASESITDRAGQQGGLLARRLLLSIDISCQKAERPIDDVDVDLHAAVLESADARVTVGAPPAISHGMLQVDVEIRLAQSKSLMRTKRVQCSPPIRRVTRRRPSGTSSRGQNLASSTICIRDIAARDGLARRKPRHARQSARCISSTPSGARLTDPVISIVDGCRLLIENRQWLLSLERRAARTGACCWASRCRCREALL